MKFILNNAKLQKGYTTGKIKVAVTVNGRFGQYQSHRWKSPKQAIEVLRSTLKREGIEIAKFKDKTTGKIIAENQLTNLYKEAAPDESFVEWVRGKYKIIDGEKESKVEPKATKETKTRPEIDSEIAKYRTEIKTIDEIVEVIKSQKEVLSKSKNTDRDAINSISTMMDIMGISKKGLKINPDVGAQSAAGYCVVRDPDTLRLQFSEIVVGRKNPRSVHYVIKTIIHENAHLLSQGKKISEDNFRNEKKRSGYNFVDESITELIAMTLHSKYSDTPLVPSYSRHLVKFIPKIIQLDEYKDCKTVYELGERFLKQRLEGTEPDALELNDRLAGLEIDKRFYSQYHDYITENLDTITRRLVELMPGAKDLRKNMGNDIVRTRDVVQRVGYEDENHDAGEVLTYSSAICLAILENGINDVLDPKRAKEEKLKRLDREKIVEVIKLVMEGHQDALKKAEVKLKGLYNKKKWKSGKTKSHITLDVANTKVNQAIDSKAETKEKQEFKQDMAKLYALLSSGAITLTQALNNPQFSGCAYVLLLALEDEDNISDDIDIILELMGGQGA